MENRQGGNTRGQQVIHCPNCGESRVRESTFNMITVSLGVMVAGMIIPIIGWVTLFPLGIIMLLISTIRRTKAKELPMQCQSCKHLFFVSRGTFEEYQKALKHKQ